jgi:hypothetical protein
MATTASFWAGVAAWVAADAWRKSEAESEPGPEGACRCARRRGVDGCIEGVVCVRVCGGVGWGVRAPRTPHVSSGGPRTGR